MKGISKIILGTAQFGLAYGINNKTGKPSQELVFEILNLAYDSGIRILDSAEAYGNAHKVIGNFHARHPDRKFEIISKLPHDFEGNIAQKINKYLDELGTSKLKALLFHSYKVYKSNRLLFDKKHRADYRDKFELTGVSVYTNEEFSDVIDDETIDIIQLPFNLFDNISLRGELIAKAKGRGKMIHTRSAFLQGLFFVEDSNKTTEALKKEIKIVKDFCAELNISISTLALNYCIQQPLIDNVLIGVETMEQLQQNLESSLIEIPQNYISKINSIIVNNKDLLNPVKWN